MVGGPVEHVGLRDIDNVSRRSLSFDRISADLGWQPQTQLGEGIRLTREWMEER
jgi:nucleoside-diphosphate-sugar epimerase